MIKPQRWIIPRSAVDWSRCFPDPRGDWIWDPAQEIKEISHEMEKLVKRSDLGRDHGVGDKFHDDSGGA